MRWREDRCIGEAMVLRKPQILTVEAGESLGKHRAQHGNPFTAEIPTGRDYSLRLAGDVTALAPSLGSRELWLMTVFTPQQLTGVICHLQTNREHNCHEEPR